MRTPTAEKGLSNIELAGNSTWVVALTRSRCPFCSFVSSDIGLTALATPCPRCAQSGSAREMFPSGVCIRRLEIVAEAYVRAYAAASEKHGALAEDLRQILGRTPERSWLDSAVRRVRRLSRSSTNSGAEYEKFLHRLQQRLCVKDPNDSARIFYLLATYKDTSSEHYNVVTSTASLFEQLFREFLVELLVSKGEKYRDARRFVSDLRRWRQQEERFKSVTGAPLHKAIDGFGVTGLYQAWRDVAKRRNDYSHVSPWAVGAQTAESAFGAAKNAFGLFSYLHNAHCLAPVSAAESSAG